MSTAIIIFAALWAAGIAPAFVLLYEDVRRFQWWMVPAALLWPPLIYGIMFFLAVRAALEMWWNRK